jgi:O-methyltransferase involved in polyketide biosynthesis
VTQPTAAIAPRLAGVPETMLWALHNRAAEARRTDGVIVDPDCLHIHGGIDYDFGARFGDPSGSLAVRAAAIDGVLRQWLLLHPDGVVVSLGEGLETQRRRVDNGRMRWLSVDLPEAISLRDHFLPATDRFRHLAVSAADPAWMDAVDPSAGVFIIAQGLLMYLDPERVSRLLCGIADRFPGAEMVFDSIPRWFSDLTLLGVQHTRQYRLPPMPWGINRDEIAPVLQGWNPKLGQIAFLEYGAPRGWARFFGLMIDRIPMVRHEVPSLVHVTIAAEPTTQRRSAMTLCTQDSGTLSGMFAAATRNAGSGSEIAAATGKVIAKRVALGVGAAFNPWAADHAEFNRMVPEKVEAFASAGRIMLKHSGEGSLQFARLASDEVMTATRATVAMAACRNAASLAAEQRRFALAWFERISTNFLAMGTFALTAQAAAMSPIRATVVGNAARLGR